MKSMVWWTTGVLILCFGNLQAAEMKGRVMVGEQTPVLGFRSETGPITRVAIVPSAKQLADNAVEASYGKAPVPIAARILGIGNAPEPLAPQRVGAIFGSDAPAFSLEWQVLKEGFVTHARIESKGAKGVRAKLLLPPGVTLGPATLHAAQDGGYDAVLLNTAVAKAADPVAMANAFRLGVEAGRIAYEAGLMEARDFASPSTPVVGTPFWHAVS